MTQVTSKEAQEQLSELIAKAAHGEEVIITSDDHPAMKLVPAEATGELPRVRRAGSIKGKVIMAEDFDAPLDDFKEYM
ncbi:MAG: type II toxin-antitoxin system prevent-host-death family antitoxin [Phycisphaeraceae bacterium]